MREYNYEGAARLGVTFLEMGGAAAILSVTLGVGWLIIMAVQVGPSSYEVVGCMGAWTLLFGWLIGLTLINSAPTIRTSDEGLFISTFIFGRVKIPWAEIIDVGAGHVPFGHTLIRARHITPFHRIYGWLYSRTLFPSFIIQRDIQDREELLREIRRKTTMRTPNTA